MVPRWSVIAAHAVPLCVLPSGLWRIAAWLNLIPGARASSELFDPALGAYIFALSVVSEAAALLTLGLVRPWGEVVPTWVPWLGGRPVSVRAAVTAALSGLAVLLLIAMLPAILDVLDVNVQSASGDDGGTLPTGFWYGLTVAAYAPLVAWPPLLAAVTWSYWRRRTGRSQPGYCRQYS